MKKAPFLLAGLLAFAPMHAARADGVQVHVREASLAPGGARLVVQVTGLARALTSADFAVTEDGRAVSGVSAQPLSPASQRGLAVALAIDESGSTAGAPAAAARAAAVTFANSLPAGTRIALIAFSDRARIVLDFTTDRAQVARAVSSLTASGGTALYDALALAASAVSRTQAIGNIVVFTDGKNTAGKTSIADAISGAKDAHAPVTVIDLHTPDLDVAASQRIADATGGRRFDVSGSSGLQGAFGAAARDVASQYVVTYSAARAGATDVQIAVTVAGASDALVATAPAVSGPARVPALGSVAASHSPLTGAIGLWLGIGAAFASLLIFAMTLFWRTKPSVVVETLQRGLKVYARGGKTSGPGTPRDGEGFARKVGAVADRLPRPHRWEQRLQYTLDRAAWPLRASEFLGMQIAAAIAGGVTGGVLIGAWWLAIFLGGFAAATPSLILMRRVAKRGTQLMAQLPDTLQLLAGSLQAGYGFMQAIDTLVKEAPQPTAAEFGRVLAEARLGMPVEDALDSMAERLGSEDLRWVVLAINIQRQVGGNLSSLLRTVSDTLRERDRVRRQIKVLSAEGKLSAYILIGLPFGIAGYITLVNPTFMHQLTSDHLGKIMIAFAVTMMGIGIFWMRKVIKIEV